MATFEHTAEPVEEKEFSLIPGGKYAMIITDTEIKDTKARTGTGIKIKYEILEGSMANRKMFDWINLTNPNPKAVEIGKETLNRICAALSLGGFKDTAELHNKPFTGVVRHKADQNGNPEARVQDFLPAGEHDVGAGSVGTLADNDEPPF